ncbi:MAG: ATP-binding protein [Myxococcota bacterium]
MPRAVRVPEPYARLFDEAEAWVRRHFAHRVESPEQGIIEIDGERYVLLRAASVSVEFFDMIRRLYADEGDEAAHSIALSLLYDVAHSLGAADARAFAERQGDAADPVARLAAGPLHFAYAGWALVDIHADSRPVPDETYRLIFDHGNSFEADSWLRADRTSGSPVCVMSAGYSAGWCEVAFEMPLVATEVQCRACGDDQCRFVMGPPEHIEDLVRDWASRHPHITRRGTHYEIPGFFRRKKWEVELRDTEDRYRTVFESVADGLVVVDGEGRIRELNPAARNLLGVSDGGATGAGLATWFPERATLHRALEDALVEGEATLETSLRASGGRLREVDVHMTRQRHGRCPQVLLSLRDVTERRRARAAMEEWTRSLEAKVARRTADLRRANERLREDMEARLVAENARRELEARLERARRLESLGVLAGGVAHDLNNLLGPLVGYPELILGQLDEASPVRPFLEEMQRSAEETGAVVQDLLSLARRGVYHMKRLDVAELVRDFVASGAVARRLAAVPGVTLRVDVPDEPAPVRGSRHHLRKVLLNLVLNALDAMPEGGDLELSARREDLDAPRAGFEEIPAGRYVVMSVSDSGHGIPAEELEHIFEPFYSTRAIGRSGSGLGLAVVYGVARDHRAVVDVRSRPGGGSRFDIWLPLESEDGSPEAEPQERTDAPRGREIVLVVDDMSEQRALAAALLESLGYEAITFASGREAVSYVAEEAVALVLLDLVMPGDLDGLQTWRAMRGHRPDLSVLVVSGYDRHSRLAELREMGVEDFLQKPYTRRQLAEAIRRVLGRRA